MPSAAILRKGEMIIPDNTELGEFMKDELMAIPRKNSSACAEGKGMSYR